MLKQKAIQLNTNRNVTKGRVAKGCPQGGVLRPLHWNIVVGSLTRRLNKVDYFTEGFDNDLAILISWRHTNLICNLTSVENSLREKILLVATRHATL